MRTIEATTRFRRDYKREKKSQHGKDLDTLLAEMLDFLAADTPLPSRFKDHPLTGDWADFRDCHVLPDLVLIYRKTNADTLQLVRRGIG